MTNKKKKILFLRAGNSCRSQMEWDLTMWYNYMKEGSGRGCIGTVYFMY